jgi:hypothetical protein
MTTRVLMSTNESGLRERASARASALRMRAQTGIERGGLRERERRGRRAMEAYERTSEWVSIQ